MNRLTGPIKYLWIPAFAGMTALLLPNPSQALSITGAGLSNTTIACQTNCAPTGTTVQFTLDVAADITVDIHYVQNFSDSLSAANRVASIERPGLTAGAKQVFWNALWLIGGDLGRYNGNYKFVVSASSDSSVSTTLSDLLSITSVDVHSMSVTPSLDADGTPSFPYKVNYALAKDSLVTARITNAEGNLVRTLFIDRAQAGEQTLATITVNWDGLDDDGRPVPLAVYTVTVTAKDASSGDTSTPRTRTVAIQSLASLGTDPKSLFERNVFVFPNPVRKSNATFQFQSIRTDASVSLKIYTLAGDLVLDRSFGNLTAGNITQFVWDGKNASGKGVGRGLYFYVVREESPQGTLQTVKKFAVID